ncbi:hypothetical protein HYW42_02815 [Candidatus Daviesbacteria bacterium]|nr:hypothetical protein [Candidatus Daviesbacteria bacterium]
MRKKAKNEHLQKLNLFIKQQQHLKKVYAQVKGIYLINEKIGLVMGGHGLDHVQRVAGMSAVLSSLEGVSPYLPILAALIHDLGRISNDPRAKTYLHGQLSVKMSKEI